MKEFASSLRATDDMAVLCVLSHGCDQHVFGADRKLVRENDIVDILNNVKCKAMADKPKILIIQACQTGKCCLLQSKQHFYKQMWILSKSVLRYYS